MNRQPLVAVLLPCLALALQWVLWPWLSPLLWFLFFPAVFFSARLDGLRGGLLSTMLSAGIVWYFFIPPQLAWGLGNPHNLYSVGLFLLMGYLFSHAQEHLRRAQRTTEAALAEIRTTRDEIVRLYRKTLDLDRLRSESFANVSHESCRDLAAQELPVMILTAKADDAPRVPMLELGVQDDAEQPFSMQALLTRIEDLLERHRQQDQRLRVSEARFEATFEQAAVGLAQVALGGRWLRTNRRLCEIVGYSQAELLERTFRDITHPADLVTELKFVRQMLVGEIDTYAMEKRFIRKDGGNVWINLAVALVRTSEGHPDYFVAVVEAIGARTGAQSALSKSEAALRESREHLRLFIEHAPASLAMFDRNMRYLAVSRRWLDDYHLNGRNVLGQSYYAIFPEIPETWRQVHRRGLAGEVVRTDADRFKRPDGSVQWLRWEVRPWHTAGDDIGGIVIFIEDISHYTLARQEIERLNADLERRVAERTAELSAANRELDSFAYAVSHDLRAPLRAMSGFSRALMEDYGDRLNGEAKLYLRQIDVASRRMRGLIDGLLTLSRSTHGELPRNRVDISALAERLFVELARNEPGRQVVIQVEPGLGAYGDARMLEAALGNLLSNAWKYTTHTANGRIRIYAEERAGWRWICVADNGAGFDTAHAARLFQPFQRLHRQDEFPGIGIGLATVQRIVHRHGGLVEAEGEPGRGAVFRIALPEPHPAASD